LVPQNRPALAQDEALIRTGKDNPIKVRRDIIDRLVLKPGLATVKATQQVASTPGNPNLVTGAKGHVQ
jgi:hypothetical protein